MAYPYKKPKIRGVVKRLTKTTVEATGIFGEDWHLKYPPEWWLIIDRSAFGPDADKLHEGSYISHPSRRDARWMLTPIPPRTEQQYRKAMIDANLYVKRMRKLFDREDSETTNG